MSIWRNHRTLIILAAILTILVFANLALFLPRFVRQSRLLTNQELTQDNQQLEQVARDGADLSQKMYQHKITATQQQQTFDQLLRQADDIIVRLQTVPHVISLEDRTRQTLQLAQIISFTLRDVQIQPEGQNRDLKAANTAQVLNQAANTATTLEVNKP